MSTLPIFNHLHQLKDQIVSIIFHHKLLFILSLIISISLVTFILLVMRLQNYLQSHTATNQATRSSDIYYASKSGNPKWYLDSASAAANSILGVSDTFGSEDVEEYDILPIYTPYPLPTTTPVPTTAPRVSTTTSCAGTPTAYYSEAIVSTSSTLVNNAVTITIELRDCNNNVTSVNDTLTISLSNNNSSARINGSPSPVTIQAQNGKATFSVNSQNTGTDTFVIFDSTRPFTVTDPHNHNPSVTYTNNTSGNSHCTTAAGVPNAWFSNVYPNPPISTSNGSIILVINIRDCDRNLAPVAETLSISLSSGDPNTKVNGNALPYSVTTQNGEAQFTVSSQVVGTVTLIIQDSTSSFPVTDPNDHNPSISFTASSTPTPADTLTPTPTTTNASTPTPTAGDTSTPTPTSSPSPTLM
jgi:hypothetical protein